MNSKLHFLGFRNCSIPLLFAHLLLSDYDVYLWNAAAIHFKRNHNLCVILFVKRFLYTRVCLIILHQIYLILPNRGILNFIICRCIKLGATLFPRNVISSNRRFAEMQLCRIVVLPKKNCPKLFDRIVTWPNHRISETS